MLERCMITLLIVEGQEVVRIGSVRGLAYMRGGLTSSKQFLNFKDY